VALTPRQAKFVESYSGNATEAAKQAGYSAKTAHVQGCRLLRNAQVTAAIKARTNKDSVQAIATRQQRQAFWSDMMLDSAEEPNVRLKASELLGRSEADFVERQRHEGADGRPLVFKIDLGEGK
jgi:phage terminase small subunit